MTDVHQSVASAYAQALRRSKSQIPDCCATSCCETASSAASQTSDYGPDTKRFADAAASSFGCGNPLAFSEVEPGQTVLDLGSGAGLDLLIASDKVGPKGRVIGVDMTDAMLQAATDHIRRAGARNIDLRKGFIESLPVDSNSVDWVISNCVINLSPDKAKVFAEIARVLRPNGRFSISDIVVDELPPQIRENRAAYTACIAGAISEADCTQGLKRAGLQEVEVVERFTYNAAQLRAIVASDLSNLNLPKDMLDTGLSLMEGKVHSVKFRGRL